MNNYQISNYSTNFGQKSYGNIQRIGTTQDNRDIYRVIDSNGKEAGRLSIPQYQRDTFEHAYKDIMETAPKIQKYAFEHSSESEIQKRKNLSRTILASGAIIGGGLTITLTRNLSITKRILSGIGGILLGLAGGFAVSLSATTPPGSYKFVKATKTFSKLDIKPIDNSNT